MDTEAHIITETQGALGLVTLNRPRALNALTRGMCLGLEKALAAWAADDGIKTVAIRGVGERAFCAGGDIRAMAESASAGTSAAAGFLADEYRTNAAIGAFPKPYVALWRGIVMGGGAGVSVHGSHRLADASLTFAMPETAIGFIPDVGASYFLSRCPGMTGLYLGLTGARIGAGDALYLGLATASFPAERHDALLEKFAAGEDAASAIAQLQDAPPPAPMAERQREIDTLFSAPSMEMVLERLDRDGGPFASECAAAIRARSPLSAKLAFAAFHRGRTLSRNECLKMEYRIGARAVMAPDFREGVRTQLVDKGASPHWNPPQFAGISDDMVAAHFATLGPRELVLD